MRAYRICIIAITLLLPAVTSPATPTEDQARQLLTERSIPNWKRASAQISDLKNRLSSTPFHEAWNTLADLARSQSGVAAATRASNPRDSRELIANSAWLRWKILADKVDGRYSYNYSYLLGQMKNPDGDFVREAVVFFYHGRLAINVDGASCIDRSRVPLVIEGYETQPSYQRIRSAISSMTPS